MRTDAPSPLFASPREAVELVNRLVAEERWRELLAYYHPAPLHASAPDPDIRAYFVDDQAFFRELEDRGAHAGAPDPVALGQAELDESRAGRVLPRQDVCSEAFGHARALRGTGHAHGSRIGRSPVRAVMILDVRTPVGSE